MSIVRSVAAVLAGAIVIFILVGIFNVAGAFICGGIPDSETGKLPADANVTGMSVWNVAWYFPIALAGGWIAALIAGRKPMLHAGIIAALIVIGGIAYVFVGPAQYEKVGAEIPGWYLPLLPLTGALGALLGGRLRARKGAATQD